MVKYLRYLSDDGETRYCLAAKAYAGEVPDIPAPLPYVKLVCSQRQDDTFHVTDFNNGPRYNALMKKAEIIVDLDDSAFRVMGVSSHAILEENAEGSGMVLPEVKMEAVIEGRHISGTADLVVINDAKEAMIIDYKILGSYAVTKLFGMDKVEEAVLDENGKPVYLKSGKNAGQPKTKTIWKHDPAKRDIKNYTRQLNIYRRLFQMQEPEITVTQLKLFVIVRDGGTEIARSRGIMRSTYLIDIPMASEDMINSFMASRIEENSAPLNETRICSDLESWEGRRCKDYCPVALECSKFNDNRWLGTVDIERMLEERRVAKEQTGE